jgi:hypothetical protein
VATKTSLRSRRTEAQRHALAGVEREIRAHDHNGRRKYLLDFTQAFRAYDSVLSPDTLHHLVCRAGTVLIGDYHALPAAQHFATTLLESRAQPGDRPVVLGLETIFARDQHIVDEWWRREIDEREFRERIRFDLDWGYDWSPFYELLITAREHAEGIYGLDCMPREDLRKIGARDRHAAHKIAEIRQRHPHAAILALFGESHLAPHHLPRCLRTQLPGEGVLTVLQNVDALYWQAAGESQEQVEAVRVADDVVCAFNTTPLEKYENYRLYLSRLGRADEDGPDVAPTIYNLIDSLIRFLGINRYSSTNRTQPKFLVDLLPEVYGPASDARLRRLLSRHAPPESDVQALLHRVQERGSIYLPQVNAFYMREFRIVYAAEEAARFLHHACQGLPLRANGKREMPIASAERFYALALEHALADFGSRVLCPARPRVQGEEGTRLSRASCERRLGNAVEGKEDFCQAAELLGALMGSRLYAAYLAGTVSRGQLRRLFLAHVVMPGEARKLCQDVISITGRHPSKARAAAAGQC